MTREEKIAIVEAYLYGLPTGDFSQVTFAPDVSFESPLSPKVAGQPAIDMVTGLSPFINEITIKQHIVEDDHVATLFDMDTVYGVMPVFDYFRVTEGQLKEIRPFYDPRPMINYWESANPQ